MNILWNERINDYKRGINKVLFPLPTLIQDYNTVLVSLIHIEVGMYIKQSPGQTTTVTVWDDKWKSLVLN